MIQNGQNIDIALGLVSSEKQTQSTTPNALMDINSLVNKAS